MLMTRLYELADGLRHRARMRGMPRDHALGKRGEDIAHRFLQRAGMVIVARNYRTESGSGEVDLIGWDGEALVFIEVKSRSSDEHGAPDRAIGRDKKIALFRAARNYARHADVAWEHVRFDVVNVLLRTPPAVTHFRNAFQPPR